jgi:PAT family beta-lactamase induction signal transducer AmpG
MIALVFSPQRMQSPVSLLRSFIQLYGTPLMLVLTVMGFSSGLPLAMLGQPLQAWMTDAGVGTITIGLAALIGLPYSFKFLWAPFLDRFIPPLPGRFKESRRRSWLALLQILLCVGIGLLGYLDPRHFEWLFLMATAVAFLSASQDIQVDAHRTDLLSQETMGAGVAVYVFGYRIALLMAGVGALRLADYLEWSQVYLIMGGLMLVGVIASYFSPEPEDLVEGPKTLTAAVIEPFRAFLRHYPQQDRSWVSFRPLQAILERPLALWTLGFVAVYQLADRISAPMSVKFLRDLGFSNTDLSNRYWMIFFATLAGVFVGGWAVKRLGIRSSLIWFGIVQGISNLSFMALALAGQDYPVMYGATFVENFSGGTGTAAFLAFLMSLCDKQFSATQYALLSSLFGLGGALAGSTSGWLAEQVGWAPFWGLTSLGALPGLVLILSLDLLSRPQKPEEPAATTAPSELG